MNLFDSPAVAARYAADRPRIHDSFVRILEAHTGRVQRALDVACGTGMSAAALLPIAKEVVGVDASVAMVAAADCADGAAHAVAKGELLPFKSSSFELVTAALALHWLRREPFLAEASRVLAAGGWLAVYNSWFAGSAGGSTEFGVWWRSYLARFPSPSRDRRAIAVEDACEANLEQVLGCDVPQEIALSLDGFVGYLGTQTNLITASEGSDERLSAITAQLRQELEPMFPSATVLQFGGSLSLYRKKATA